jgi:hypothetical protein
MLKMKAQTKVKPKNTPLMAIANGFWDAYREWIPNTPTNMARVALMALERDGWKLR